MTWILEQGDCRERMAALPAESVDAIVTDPPYGLAFMGKAWDHGVPGVPFWVEALRVAKPGAYLVAFGGTRTYHRLTVAIEDAGWEIRDCLSWLYGSGFPKSHNGPWGGTALKPAWEPIIMARKPLVGTVAANVVAHGTGGLKIDGCRTALEGEVNPSIARRGGATTHLDGGAGKAAEHFAEGRFVSRQTPEAFKRERPGEALGRWPANVILDEVAAAMLDAQSGKLTSGREADGGHRRNGDKFRSTYGEFPGTEVERGVLYGDTGGASRFFYCAKASRSEREAGLEGMPESIARRYGEQGQGSTEQQTPRVGRAAANFHPTVKPLALMRWLCRLVTPTSVSVLECVDCGNEHPTTQVPGVRSGFQAKSRRADRVRNEVPESHSGSGKSGEPPDDSLPDLRCGVQAEGRPGAVLLDPMQGGESEAATEAVPNVRQGVSRPITTDVLLETVCGRGAEDALPETVREVRGGVPANEGRQAEVLHAGLCGKGERVGAPEAGRPARLEGIHPAVGAGAPDGEPSGVRDGSPTGGVGTLGPDAEAGRSGASSERRQGRQQDREPGADAEASTRPPLEAKGQADNLPPLRREDRCVGACTSCGGDLAVVTRPGKILDPFTGSGTTGCAALLEGFRFHGMELTEEYLPIAAARLAHWQAEAHAAQPSLFDSDPRTADATAAP